MEVDPISLLGTSLALIGLIGEHFYYQAALRERITRLETQIKETEGMSEDVREIKTKINLFWNALETQIPSLLMKGNPIDENSMLFNHLQKFISHQITPLELQELVCELDIEAKNDSHPAGEKLALVLISAIVKTKYHNNGDGIWMYT